MKNVITVIIITIFAIGVLGAEKTHIEEDTYLEYSYDKLTKVTNIVINGNKGTREEVLALPGLMVLSVTCTETGFSITCGSGGIGCGAALNSLLEIYQK